jgi:hypothetical protein
MDEAGDPPPTTPLHRFAGLGCWPVACVSCVLPCLCLVIWCLTTYLLSKSIVCVHMCDVRGLRCVLVEGWRVGACSQSVARWRSIRACMMRVAHVSRVGHRVSRVADPQCRCGLQTTP